MISRPFAPALMPNFNWSPSLPVENIENAFILTLLIEMMVGVGLERINRGCNLCAQEPPPCRAAGVAIFETIFLVLLAPFMARLTLTRGRHPGRRQQKVEARSQTPRDHTIRLLEFPCGGKL